MSLVTLELIARRNNKPTKWEMKGEKIKPCPFCAGSNIALVEDEGLHWCSDTEWTMGRAGDCRAKPQSIDATGLCAGPEPNPDFVPWSVNSVTEA